MSASLQAPPAVVAIPEHLQADYARCRLITRAHARNFYYGLRLSPEPKRSAVYAVYAWMRTGDDDIDLAGSLDEKRRRLAEFTRRSEAVLSGLALPEQADEPVWRAFAHTVRSFNIDREDLRQLLLGLSQDLDNESASAPAPGSEPASVYPRRADLERYCYRVASVVGLICIDIWGLRDRSPAARDEARRLGAVRGLAFQLTNILRDFGEDFDRGRVYIPSEDLERHQVRPIAVRAWSDPRRSAALVRDVARWARACYEQSAPLDAMIDPTCAPTLWAMTRIYSRLLEKIDARPERIVSARVRVRAIHKAGIALAAAIKARARML